MKTIATKTIIVVTLWLAGAAHAEPPPGGQPPSGGQPPAGGQPPPGATSVVVLNSPCYQAEGRLRKVAAHAATIAGQEPTLPLATTQGALDQLSDMITGTQGLLIQCYELEADREESARRNRGQPGKAEVERFNAAVVTLGESIDRLLALKAPGQSDYDVALNSTVAEFYDGWVKEFRETPNLSDVKGIQDRLREAYSSLLKATIACRRENRKSGDSECAGLGSAMELADFKLTARVSTLAPTLSTLNREIDQLSDQAEATSKRMASVIAHLEQLRTVIPQTIGALQWWQGAARWHMNMYWYHVVVAHQFASVGWWGHFWYFIGVANLYLGAFQQAVYVVIPSIVAQLNGHMATVQRLQGEMPGLQERMMELMSEIEKRKGTIVALPVARLDR